jgi:hypothetical protein
MVQLSKVASSQYNRQKLNFQDLEEVETTEGSGKQFIDGVFDASLDGIFICSAIRSDDGPLRRKLWRTVTGG